MTLHLVTDDTPGPADGSGSTAIHVVDLTDEELLGIDGPSADHVAPLPWLGDRPAEEVELAAEVGLRSLVNHGRALLGEDGVRLPQDLAPMLDLRHCARTIVYADHSTPHRQETRILYVHPHAVLSESINAAGIHRFVVGDLDDALEDLATWCVPQRSDADDRSVRGEDLPTELIGLQAAVLLDVVSLPDEAGPAAERTQDVPVETRSLTLYRLADGTVVEGIETPERLDLPARRPSEVRHRVFETVLAPGQPDRTT